MSTPEVLEPVENYIDEAILVAFDGCHKIYLALDEIEAKFFRDEYPHVVENTSDTMLATVVRWYGESCGLKFVQGVRHNAANPNAGFTSIVDQGAEDAFIECGDCGSTGDTNDWGLCDDCDNARCEEEEVECPECGESGYETSEECTYCEEDEEE